MERETKNKDKKQKTVIYIYIYGEMNSTISIITLNANSLNTPIKRQIIRYQSRLKEKIPIICYLQ